MIDWARPLIAVPSERFCGGRIASVAIAKDYAKRAGAMPVRFDQNLWVQGCEGGVWYFDHTGRAVAGVSEDGYDARYYIANA